MAPLSLVFWTIWLWHRGSIQWASNLCFCWYNICIYIWEVMMNIFLIFYQDVVTYLTIIMFHDRISITFVYSNIFRYVKICHPLKTLLHFGKRRTLAVIILIWVISIIFSVAWTNFTEVSMIFIFIISNKNLSIL